MNQSSSLNPVCLLSQNMIISLQEKKGKNVLNFTKLDFLFFSLLLPFLESQDIINFWMQDMNVQSAKT